MLTQYEILVNCQSEVRGANLPDMDKFRLEVQLIECKRLLLSHLFDEGWAGAVGIKEEFCTLHEHFERVCSSRQNDVGVSLLVTRLNDIMRQLNREMECDVAVC